MAVPPEPLHTSAHSATMHYFLKGTFFDFETVRVLGMVPYSGADVVEVLEVVGDIKDGDSNS
jgi:hypothetical protein